MMNNPLTCNVGNSSTAKTVTQKEVVINPIKNKTFRIFSPRGSLSEGLLRATSSKSASPKLLASPTLSPNAGMSKSGFDSSSMKILLSNEYIDFIDDSDF